MKKSSYKVWLRIVISTALMIFLLKKLSISDLVELILTIDTRIFAAGIICFFLSNLLGSIQWHQLLGASGIRLSFGQT